MIALLGFGERKAGFDIPVLNEREVRAGAGILFALAMVSFMQAWLTGDFRFTRVFVIAFLIDFTLRVFVNPRLAPSLVIGRFAVRWQTPEYVGAPQKRFAWLIGWGLAVLMTYLVVIERVVGPINLIVCLTCLILLFFEAVFGICLACKIYNAFSRNTAQHCPGGVCEVRQPQRISPAEAAVLVAFFGVVAALAQPLMNDPRDLAFQAARQQAAAAPVTTVPEVPPDPVIQAPAQSTPKPPQRPASKPVAMNPATTDAATPAPTGEDCTPPDWAVKMGHAEMWKLHHNCP